MIQILIDNRTADSSNLSSEHGLSIYFDLGNQHWLLDVGASDLFAHNAEALGIDLEQIDGVILSHAHADHTGGLAAFLQRNAKAKIYCSSAIQAEGYYSTRRGSKRSISIDYSLLESHKERFVRINRNVEIAPNLYLLSSIPHRYACPKANSTLLEGCHLDAFHHELAVVLKDQKTLLSSCSHLGLLNTLAAASDLNIDRYIGGLHLVDSTEGHTFESPAELHALAQHIMEHYPSLEIYTGHCTGERAFESLRQILGDQIHQFYTGYTIP